MEKPKCSPAVKVVTEEAIHPCPLQLREKESMINFINYVFQKLQNVILFLFRIPINNQHYQPVSLQMFPSLVHPFSRQNLSICPISPTHVHIAVVIVLNNDVLTLSRNKSTLLLPINNNWQYLFHWLFLLLMTKMTLC